MNCKRCGSFIPGDKFTCPNCGMLMDQKQIELQKQLNKDNNNIEYLNQKYGGKSELFTKREEKENKLIGLIFILIVIIILILITLIVYFK